MISTSLNLQESKVANGENTSKENFPIAAFTGGKLFLVYSINFWDHIWAIVYEPAEQIKVFAEGLQWKWFQ